MRLRPAIVLAVATAAALSAAHCATNVTLGSAPDDPNIPHRITPEPHASTPAPVPVSTPVPSSVSTVAPEAPLAAGRIVGLTQSLGDPVRLTAEPCVARGIHARVVVPRPEDLDLSYAGAVPGVEIRRSAPTGTGGFRHAKLADGVLEADLWARGSGLLASSLGKETCASGAAADVSFEFFAHYK